MLHWPADAGGWTIGGQSMIWAGAKPLDLELLWSSPELEVDNLEMPGVDGTLPRDLVVVEAEHEIRYQLSGLVLPNGNPAPSLGAGFIANHRQLVARVGSPAAWGGPSVASVVTLPDGTTIDPGPRGIQAWVSPIGGSDGSVARCSVRVLIPAGAFT